ncbi:MAG: 4Fe-4S cluster-binding domain-containing protein [Actinomycetota bacterium]|nr:4Fe-4S cluster-binding domain-containing protein [Actinomycetota bacterium]MDQ2956119.1 4Fe-4S cluster-binding domain-containing protein [Actinomycetota bacterium]
MQLNTLFDAPETSRRQLIADARWAPSEIPGRGSSFFIHLSELCPVACEHCMYSSDLVQKTAKPELNPDELERAIGFINESQSDKLNITGGGEPFLKLPSILQLLEKVNTPRIEIVTAGYWAKSYRAADKMLTRLSEALRRNHNEPEVMLRLSLDRYHVNAPQPVLIEYYGNVAKAWNTDPRGMRLGYRSIQPDRDYIDVLLAKEVDGELVDIDEWNRELVMPGSLRIPLTYNVFRVSGKASQLAESSDLSKQSKTVREYYGPFETGEARLSLATTVNDAIRGSYTQAAGLAVTLNSDGRFWIFCGTAPDRQQTLGSDAFQQAMRTFFEDPITRLLVDDGVWALSDLLLELDPAVHQEAIGKNDVAALVDDLLCRPDILLAVTLLAVRQYLADGRLQPSGILAELDLSMSEEQLLAQLASLTQRTRLVLTQARAQ